jgi:hypothetical protein
MALNVQLLNRVKDEVANSEKLLPELRREKWIFLTDKEKLMLWPLVCEEYSNEILKLKNKNP